MLKKGVSDAQICMRTHMCAHASSTKAIYNMPRALVIIKALYSVIQCSRQFMLSVSIVKY